MALSGSTSIAATKHDTLKFSWSATQSIPNNASTISWPLQLISDAYGAISSSTNKKWSVTINGKTFSGTNTIGMGNNATKTLASSSTSGTAVVGHNSDGTKTFSYSFSQELAITFSDTYVGTKSGSGSATLNTIARASGLSVSNGTLGTAQTITADRKSSSFTHTLTWASGSYSGTIATKSTDASWPFTPQPYLANGAPNGTSVYCSFTLTTYNGSTPIGSVSKGVYMTIPDTSAYRPTCSVSVSDPTGYLSTFGGYVQGQSKFSVTVNPTLAYSSAIKSYSTTANGSTYTSKSFTTGVIKSSGTLTISAKVTDNRNRPGTGTATATVLAYTTPQIGKFIVRRCDSDGTENDQGTYAKIIYTVNITSLSSKNSKSFRYGYKKSTDTDYTYVTLDNSAYSYTDRTTNVLAPTADGCIFPAEEDSSYDAILEVSDYFTSSTPVTASANVGTTFALFHFNESGKGMAFGKISENENAIEFGMDMLDEYGTKIGNGLTVYTTEGIDANATLEHEILTQINTPITGSYYYITTTFYGSKSTTSNRSQIALPYNSSSDYNMYFRYYYDGAWTSWTKVVKSQLANQEFIYGTTTSGTAIEALNPCSTGNNCVVGYGGYASNTGATNIYGYNVNIYTKNNFTINDRAYGVNKVLWSGSWHMNANQTATLSEGKSKQPHGVIIVFSEYDNPKQVVANSNITSFFVSKHSVSTLSGCGNTFFLPTPFNRNIIKYLYISDTTLRGAAVNANSPTISGIQYQNLYSVLRYVIGV